MIIYLLIAVLTAGMAAIVDNIDNRIVKAALIALIVFVFCYFAGARDLTVGTDTGGYGYSTFLGAKAYPLETFLFGAYSGWGFLYKLVAWTSVNAFGTFGAMLFAIELCIVVPVIIVGYKYTNRHLALVTILFALYFYPLSFNLIRQSMAMSFLLVAWYALDRKRVFHFFVWLLVAALFHSSAILGLCLPVFYYIARPGRVPFRYKTLLFIVLSMLGLLLMPYALSAIAPYLPHYGAYVTESNYAISGHGYRNTIEIAIAFITIYLLCRIFAEQETQNCNNDVRLRVDELLVAVLFGVIVTGISTFSVYLGRVGTYFLYFAILLIPIASDLIPGKAEQRFFAVVSIIVVALLALDLFVITGQNEVVPYVFATL